MKDIGRQIGSGRQHDTFHDDDTFLFGSLIDGNRWLCLYSIHEIVYDAHILIPVLFLSPYVCLISL